MAKLPSFRADVPPAPLPPALIAVPLLTVAAGSGYLKLSRNVRVKRVILPLSLAAAATLFFSMMWSVTAGHPP
jgi:hypothetical protein